MTTTTPSPTAETRPRVAGFTLPELMITATLGSIIMLAVLTSFLFLGRSGANLQNYAEMEAQARRAIETFALDVRMAKNATWNSTRSVTLAAVTSGGSTESYTYAYDADKGIFTRTEGGVTTTLISGISPGSFNFTAYKINTAKITLSDDASALSVASGLTKQIQISLRTTRSTRTVTDATNAVISARFILRNKSVTA